MAALSAPNNIPEISVNLSDISTRERIHDLAVKDMDNIGHAPPCPKGETCDCPRAKAALGLASHQCDPDPDVHCVVFHILTKEGVLLV